MSPVPRDQAIRGDQAIRDELRPLAHAQAVALSGDDAWLRFAVDPAPETTTTLHLPDAGLLVVARPGLPAGDDVTLLPVPGADPERALAAARPLLPPTGSLTLPRAHADLAERALGLDPAAGVGWDWTWTDVAPPPIRAEAEVVDLHGDDGTLPPDTAAEMRALLARHSPRHSLAPGSARAVGWVGVRRQERLVACAGWLEPAPGIPLLASVAVHPRARRSGLGAALTAAIARRTLLGGAPAVTVDLYADNDSARRLYARLGFVTAREFGSWSLQARR